MTDIQRRKEICEAASKYQQGSKERHLFLSYFPPAFCLKLLAVVEDMERIQKASHCNVSTYGIWIKEICDKALAALEQEEGC